MQILPEDDTVPLTPLPVAQSGLSSDWPESCGNHGDLYEVSMTEHICGNAIDARCAFVFFSLGLVSASLLCQSLLYNIMVM